MRGPGRWYPSASDSSCAPLHYRLGAAHARLGYYNKTGCGMGDLVARRYVKDPAFVYREIAGEAILVPIRRSVADMESVYTLDSVAADIWKLIDGDRTLSDILDVLLSEYDVDAAVLSRDLDEFVEQLEAIGAIRVV